MTLHALTQATTAITNNSEPIVTGALVAGAGGILFWFANRFMKMLSLLQSLSAAIFGDPNVPDAQRNGLIRKLDSIDHRLIEHSGQFDTHCVAEVTWQTEMYRAIHLWNDRATAILVAASAEPAPPLALPPIPERRKKPRH